MRQTTKSVKMHHKVSQTDFDESLNRVKQKTDEGNGAYEFQRNGKGTMKFANGAVYTGDWVMNKKEGQGTQKFAKGGHYTGSWL